MTSSYLQSAHVRLQEALHNTPPVPGAPLGSLPPMDPPMAYAAAATESPKPQERPVNLLLMDSSSEVRAGAWHLQQIAYQMHLIRAWYPLPGNPHTRYTDQWIKARAHHTRLLHELEQGLPSYLARGLCQVQYVDIETATQVPLGDEHEIRVESGVRRYQVYSGHILLHYRKVLKFQFVDVLHLGPENPNLFLHPQPCLMDSAHVSSHSWQPGDDFHWDSSRPPTPRLHPQVMPISGEPLVASPVQLPRSVMPFKSLFQPMQGGYEGGGRSWGKDGEGGDGAGDEEQSWDEYEESLNDADDEGDSPGDRGSRNENDYDEYYPEYLESDFLGGSRGGSESEDSFHGFSPPHMSTAGIRYLYRASHGEALRVTSGVHAAVSSYNQALHAHPQSPFGVYTSPGSSTVGFRNESDGGCPYENSDTLHTENVTTLGDVALSEVISEDESEGGIPLYDSDTVGLGRILRREPRGNTVMRGLPGQICAGPVREPSQHEELPEDVLRKAGQATRA